MKRTPDTSSRAAGDAETGAMRAVDLRGAQGRLPLESQPTAAERYRPSRGTSLTRAPRLEASSGKTGRPIGKPEARARRSAGATRASTLPPIRKGRQRVAVGQASDDRFEIDGKEVRRAN